MRANNPQLSFEGEICKLLKESGELKMKTTFIAFLNTLISYEGNEKHVKIPVATVGALGQPMFVKSKDPVSRRVVLTANDRLFEKEVWVNRLNLIATERLAAPIQCEVKIRYNHKGAPATVIPTGENTALIRFEEPQRAPADGQSAVFYDGETVIGGGIIRQNQT